MLFNVILGKKILALLLHYFSIGVGKVTATGSNVKDHKVSILINELSI